MSTVTYSNRTVDPDSPDSGEVVMYMKDGQPYWRDENGDVHTLETPASPVFGTSFQQVSDDTYITHNDNDPLFEYLTTDEQVCDQGKYRVGVTLCWNLSSGSRNFVAELWSSTALLGVMEIETKDTGSDIRNWTTSFFYYDHIGGALSFGIYVGPETNGDIAKVYYAGIEKWRVE